MAWSPAADRAQAHAQWPAGEPDPEARPPERQPRGAFGVAGLLLVSLQVLSALAVSPADRPVSARASGGAGRGRRREYHFLADACARAEPGSGARGLSGASTSLWA